MVRLKIGSHTFDLPESCPECHNPVIVLAYNFRTHALNAICGPAEDNSGRYYHGCKRETIATIPMSEENYRSLLELQVIRDRFACLLTMP